MTNEVANNKRDVMPTDKMIGAERDRVTRPVLLGLYSAAAWYFVPTFIRDIITLPFTKDGVVTNAIVDGMSSGLGLMGLVAILGYTIPKYFLIHNKPNRMFLTQDGIASFIGKGLVDVPYGPGWHACYPWEVRNEDSNISLEEETVIFDFNISLPDGALSGKAAYWIRPDHMHPVEFLRSVASVAEEIKTLVVAEIQKYVGSEKFRSLDIPTIDTSVIINLINEHLKGVLGGDDVRAEIEQRNGVIITGASVAELSLSGDLSKTLAGVSEARAVQLGTNILLGMKSEQEVRDAIQSGLITHEDVARARRDFLSISGNLEGMSVTRSEFDLNIRGLTPEIVEGLKEFAKSPAAHALLNKTAARAGGSSKPKGKPKS